MIRVLSISTLFPCAGRSQFGIFVANQMKTVAKLDGIKVTMMNPIGIPPWPLSLRKPYADLKRVPKTSEFDELTVHHRHFRSIPGSGADGNPKRIAAALLPEIRKLHAKQPFDLVDAQFFFPDGPAAAIIARALKLPLSIKARGADIHYWSGRPKARRQILEAAQQAAGLLAVSQALRSDMVALGMPQEWINVHYTGLDHDIFKPFGRADARALLSNVPLDKNPLLVTTGALTARKGQRFVIEALAKLPGVRLALAGGGEDEKQLRSLAAKLRVADRVHFLGVVKHSELPLLLAAADAMVLPSASEGLANAWIEALACGTPLVICDAGGATEVVQDATAGRVVKRNAEAIAAAVSDILAKPVSQQAVASNASRFRWDRNAIALGGHWRRVAGVQAGSR